MKVLGRMKRGLGGVSDTLPWGKEGEMDLYSGTDAAQTQGDGEPRLGWKAGAAWEAEGHVGAMLVDVTAEPRRVSSLRERRETGHKA